MWVWFCNFLFLGFLVIELSVEGVVYLLQGDWFEDVVVIDEVLIGEMFVEVYFILYFMGLLGMVGVLLLYYIEILQLCELYECDCIVWVFLDIFLICVVLLYYVVWKKYCFVLQYEIDCCECFLLLIMLLFGMGMNELCDWLVDGYGDVFDQVFVYYVGVICQCLVLVVLMQCVFVDYFQVLLVLEQFVGVWYCVLVGQVMWLGQVNVLLGFSVLVGDWVWQCDLCMWLSIGLLWCEQFDDFLFGGSVEQVLVKWLLLFIGGMLEYEVWLVLCQQDVCGLGLGVGNGVCLGWDSYMCLWLVEGLCLDIMYGIYIL